MTVTLQVPDEIVRQAGDRGLGVSAYIARLLEEAALLPPLPAPKELSDERFEAALDHMAQFSEKIPDLPLEAFSRESLYEGRE